MLQVTLSCSTVCWEPWTTWLSAARSTQCLKTGLMRSILDDFLRMPFQVLPRISSLCSKWSNGSSLAIRKLEADPKDTNAILAPGLLTGSAHLFCAEATLLPLGNSWGTANTRLDLRSTWPYATDLDRDARQTVYSSAEPGKLRRIYAPSSSRPEWARCIAELLCFP
jgi:hypothetical protein